MCKFIAQQYPDFVNAKNVDKWNAVMFAAKYGHVKILQFLHDHKNSLTNVSESNRTALHIASMHDYSEICCCIFKMNNLYLITMQDHQ